MRILNEYVANIKAIIIILFVVLPVGFFMQRVEKVKYAELQKCIDNEKMQVIVLREEDDAVKSRVVSACEGLWDASNPAIRFYKNSEQSLEWFRVDQNRYQGETPPAFIVRSIQKKEEPNYGVVYAAAAGHDSMSQIRKWLKVNKYSDSDYKLRSIIYNDTSQFYPIRNESKIRVDGYVETTGFMWMFNYQWIWHGGYLEKVTGEEIYEHYGKIQDLLLPARHNLMRTFGITYMFSLFWKLIYLVIKLIYYAVLITSVGLLFVGKEIVGVRPSRIVMTLRIFGLIMIPLFFIFFFLPRGLFPYYAAVCVSAALTIQYIFITWLSHCFIDYLFNTKSSYWNSFRWPINTASEIEIVTGRAELWEVSPAPNPSQPNDHRRMK